MAFCANCGADTSSAGKFCVSCGSAISPTPAVEKRVPASMVLTSAILLTVGLALVALGWLAAGGLFSTPSSATWFLWLLGGICWIVGLALPWKIVRDALGQASQIIFFVSICFLALGSLVGLANTGGTLANVVLFIGSAGVTTILGISSITRARSYRA